MKRWEGRYPKLTDWAEEQIGETLTFYRLPRQHHKHMKSTNLLERLNEEIKRRTCIVRIFPNPESCLRLIRALCVETHEAWLEDNRYINMNLLREQENSRSRPLPDHPRSHDRRRLFAQLDGHNQQRGRSESFKKCQWHFPKGLTAKAMEGLGRVT